MLNYQVFFKKKVFANEFQPNILWHKFSLHHRKFIIIQQTFKFVQFLLFSVMILYLITRILIHSWIHVILKLDKLENWSFLAHLINLNCHLHHFLIPDIRCNFRNLMNKITKRFKSLDFGPKMRHLPLFGYIK